MSAEGGTKAVVAAAAANVSIAALKLGAWALTGASSLLAEAIHSFADTGNQVLLLVGGRLAKREATQSHPFGFGRERYLTGFLVSVVLFTMGGVFALYEAYHKGHELALGHGDALIGSRWWWVPLAVLGGAIVAEGMSLRTAVNESRKTKGAQGWWSFIRTAKAPELPVILLEDLAALIGLVLALLGVGLTLLTREGIFDVIATGAIGVLLIVVASVLAVETKSLLIGEAATAEVEGRIVAALVATPGVERIIHLTTLHLGPDEVLLAAKIAVAPTDSARVVAQTIDAAEANVRAAEPLVAHIYLEPDIHAVDPEPPAGAAEKEGACASSS